MDNRIIWNDRAKKFFAETESAEPEEEKPVNPKNSRFFACPSCGAICSRYDEKCDRCRRLLK